VTGKYIINHEQALGKEIREIAEGLAAVVLDKKKASAVIALLSMAVLIQEPHLNTEQLQDIILDISQRIALLIENTDTSGNQTVQ
jgi:hypothetical protein